MATVVLEDVYKTYLGDKGREVVAVENVNLAIEDHEFIVFLGPSGCGKSTTLRMIAGLEEISKGSIFIAGRKINDVPPKDRDIAMVFQNYALYPHMTIRRNMAFGLELRKYPKAEIDRRVREAASILGLSDEMLERKPKALSGGQRQRVSALLEVIEPMGAETFFYLNTGSHAFIARSQAQVNKAVNQKMDFSVNMRKARFFEKPDKSQFKKANGEFDQDRWQAAGILIV